MQVVIYVRPTDEISIYEQYNICANFAKIYGYSIEYKVLDLGGDRFYEAINKVIVEHDVSALLIYSRDAAFDSYEDYLFYRIYCEKQDKKILACE